MLDMSIYFTDRNTSIIKIEKVTLSKDEYLLSIDADSRGKYLMFFDGNQIRKIRDELAKALDPDVKDDIAEVYREANDVVSEMKVGDEDDGEI